MINSEDLSKERQAFHRDEVIKYYEAAQRFYDFFWHGKSLGLHYGLWTPGITNRKEAILAENQVLAEKVGIGKGDLVLDAGCGVLGSGIWLAKERGAQVIGLNLVRKQLTRGKELANEKGLLIEDLGLVEADYQELPFKQESFDKFWSLESIEHTTDIDVFVHEAYRVLKKGGKIVIAGTFKGRENLSDEELRQVEVGQRAAGAFNDFRTADQVADALKQAGFINIQNEKATDLVIESSRQMTQMCKWGLPLAKIGEALRLTSPIITINNEWGTYQEGLFRSGGTSYNILTAEKTYNQGN